MSSSAEVRHLSVSNSPVTRLGYQPQVTVEDGLRQMAGTRN
ncbi:hypothetical protein [Paractinoplanes toevensis]|nr:hypothetical protein [Actinoplanes toevensis]